MLLDSLSSDVVGVQWRWRGVIEGTADRAGMAVDECECDLTGEPRDTRSPQCTEMLLLGKHGLLRDTYFLTQARYVCRHLGGNHLIALMFELEDQVTKLVAASEC